MVSELPVIRNSWDRGLERVVENLKEGQPLSEALRSLQDNFLPRYIVLAIAKAEADGQLATVLPEMARRLQFAVDLRSMRWSKMNVPLIELMMIIFVTFGAILSFLPKFHRIFDELLEGMAPSYTEYLFAIAGNLRAWIMVFTQLILLILVVWVLKFFQPGIFNFSFLEGWLLWVPGIGTHFKRKGLMEVAGAIACFTAAGDDITTAAEWTAKCTSRKWLKFRLNGFIKRLKAGENWVDAWDKMRLGSNLHRWMIRNAAGRPAELARSLEMLHIWLADEVVGRARLFHSFMAAGIILFNALIAGTIAFILMSSLFLILQTVIIQTQGV